MDNAKTPDGFSEGQIIDKKYVIVSLLGGGSTGLAYLAQNIGNMRRQVVVKTLRRDALEEPYILKHFRQEAEALERINHDGVIKILDRGEDKETDLPFLVMEYAEGETLSKIIKRGPMDVKKCADIVQKIAFALNAAHKVLVYHRDLKPDNVIVAESQDEPDRVKLVDFGIAKVKESNVGQSTTSHVLAGTLEYASPEQLNGDQSIQGEVFCLATVAYEMLTQRLAYSLSGCDAKERVNRLRELHRRGAKSPKLARQNLPNEVEPVFQKALSLDPSKRYKSPIEFAKALSRALANKPQIKPAVVYNVRPKPKLVRRILLPLVAILILLGVFYFVFWT